MTPTTNHATLATPGRNRALLAPLAEALLGRAMTRPFRLEHQLLYSRTTPRRVGLEFDALEVEVEPGLRLRGWLTSPAGPPRGTVVLLHGISSCKGAMLQHARCLERVLHF